jgi:hypothetical protein
VSIVHNSGLLTTLLGRGDLVEITDGKLVVKPGSGKEVPPKWFAEHREQLIQDVLMLVGVDAYIYNGYSTSSYPISHGKFADGMTITFESLLTDDIIHAIYNVILRRDRNTEHGTR